LDESIGGGGEQCGGMFDWGRVRKFKLDTINSGVRKKPQSMKGNKFDQLDK